METPPPEKNNNNGLQRQSNLVGKKLIQSHSTTQIDPKYTQAVLTMLVFYNEEAKRKQELEYDFVLYYPEEELCWDNLHCSTKSLFIRHKSKP